MITIILLNGAVQAKIHNNGEVIHLGYFATEGDAGQAYGDAELVQRATKGGRLHCICKQPADADQHMIQCEECDGWCV